MYKTLINNICKFKKNILKKYISNFFKDPSSPKMGFIDYDRHRTRIKDYEYNEINKMQTKEDHLSQSITPVLNK